MPLELPVYMDNHATTRVDPRVVDADVAVFHRAVWQRRQHEPCLRLGGEGGGRSARETIAGAIGAQPREIVFTSGATESNNLAIRGVAEAARRQGNHLLSVATEHNAVLDPLSDLAQREFEVTLLPVEPAGSAGWPGTITAEQVAAAIRPDTALVSVMLANNEIGVIQPIAEIGAVCRRLGVPLHCDATQGVGKIPVDVEQLQVDLLSFSAHKIYGPKGIGALYVRRKPAVRLEPQIFGGAQEHGLRSGTLNVPGIVGFAAAIELATAELPTEGPRLAALRSRLHDGLRGELNDVSLNGPALESPGLRLPGNLNMSFAYVDGEALLLSMRDLAVSSGSACTSANPEPSHVLRALGLDDDLVRASLRFGLGRFNTGEEVDFAIATVAESVRRLRQLSSLA